MKVKNLIKALSQLDPETYMVINTYHWNDLYGLSIQISSGVQSGSNPVLPGHAVGKDLNSLHYINKIPLN